jgi:hypothetical protein
MPKEQKSTREKKAVDSKAEPKKAAASATKPASAAATSRKSVSTMDAKPAVKRSRPKKTSAGDEATLPEQQENSTQALSQHADPVSHEHISVRAYYLAEELRACGEQWDSERIWLEAERQIRFEKK